MCKAQKLTGNITPPNKDMEVLRANFSQCFDKNGNFDFEKFKTELSKKEVRFSKESYSLDWLGKSYARLLASNEATTLLKENETWNDKPENKHSKNLLLKGDNLEVLKHLSNAYYEKIKMIYIDPPYNTGSDGFVYQDNRKFSVEELAQLAGIDKDKARRILDFTQSKSNSHSAWLTFMYPRLYIARHLLREDGVIFVSIDDNELAQLRLLMDEIFGEENFVAIFSVENNPKGRKNSNFVSVNNDFCLVYSKQIDRSYFIENIPKKDLKKDFNGRFYTHGKRVIVGESTNKSINNFNNEKHYSVYYHNEKNDIVLKVENDIDGKDVNLIKKGYKRYISMKHNKFIENTYTKKKFQDLFDNDSLLFKENNIYEKDFNVFKRIKSIIKNEENIDLKTETANSHLNKLFGITEGKIFDNPKNIGFIKLLLTLFEEKDFLILDFFAGSGTSGDAVMQLNVEDGGNRQFILVQLPEPIDPKKNKNAYEFVKNELGVEQPTIFDITKERLVRAAKKIVNDKAKEIAEIQKTVESIQAKDNRNKKEAEKLKYLQNKLSGLKKQLKKIKALDLGFKIFETIPVWENYDFEADELHEQLSLFDETKLTEEDLKALLTTWKTYDGIPLTEDLREMDMGGYKAYYYDTKLYLMHKGFKTKHLKKLLEEIDNTDNDFNPASIIAFGYNFESKMLRELAENVKNYANKKKIDIDFITRY